MLLTRQGELTRYVLVIMLPLGKRRQIVTQIFGVFVFVQNGSIMFVFVESFAWYNSSGQCSQFHPQNSLTWIKKYFWGLCPVAMIPGVPARDTAHHLLARNTARHIPRTKQCSGYETVLRIQNSAQGTKQCSMYETVLRIRNSGRDRKQYWGYETGHTG